MVAILLVHLNVPSAMVYIMGVPPCSCAEDTEGTVQAQLIMLAGNAAMLSNIVVCHRELGFTPVEVNASDTRNKADSSALKGVGAKLANSIKELATNTAIGMGADHKPKKVSPQALLQSVLDSCPALHSMSCNCLIRQVCRYRCADISSGDADRNYKYADYSWKHQQLSCLYPNMLSCHGVSSNRYSSLAGLDDA